MKSDLTRTATEQVADPLRDLKVAWNVMVNACVAYVFIPHPDFPLGQRGNIACYLITQIPSRVGVEVVRRTFERTCIHHCVGHSDPRFTFTWEEIGEGRLIWDCDR